MQSSSLGPSSVAKWLISKMTKLQYQVLAGVDVNPAVLGLAEDLAPNVIRPIEDPEEKNLERSASIYSLVPGSGSYLRTKLIAGRK